MLKKITLPIVLCFLTAIVAAVTVSAQDPKLQAAAKAAGLEYHYDKFSDFQSVYAEIAGPEFVFSYGGYVGKRQGFQIIVSRRAIDYDDNAIFLIDGQRLTITPIKRHYRTFGTVISKDDFAAMAEAKTLAVQIGTFEYEFTPANIRKLAALFKISYEGRD